MIDIQDKLECKKEIVEPKTNEELIEFAKRYALHRYIKNYLETKNKNILEEIKKLCKNGRN